MRAFAGEEILKAWERSRGLPEQEAALSLLAQAWPEKSLEELARLPLGERNALLLELRTATFGRGMNGFAVCPECAAPLEFALDPRALAQGLRADAAEAEDPLGMRPLNSLDLLAGSGAADEEEARSLLLARTLGIEPRQLDQLEGHTELLLQRFEQINAAAEIRLQLHCAACQGDPWLDLDLARFLLREVSSAARRLMTEIHELASAYGWSERDIAGMSPARRSAYLEMVNA